MNDNQVIELARKLDRGSVGYRQFRKCNAYISELLDDGYYLIKSYYTIVGLVDVANKQFYEIGKYSQTTSKQVTQIYNSEFRNCTRNYIEGRV